MLDNISCITESIPIIYSLYYEMPKVSKMQLLLIMSQKVAKKMKIIGIVMSCIPVMHSPIKRCP